MKNNFSPNYYKIIIAFIFVFSSYSLSAKKNKVIHLVTDNWPPYYSSDLKNQGFFTQITREAFAKENLKLKVKFTTFKKAKELAQKGIYDGILGAFYKKDRERYYQYSLPVLSTKMIFITTKKTKIKYDGDLKNLLGYKIGISKGYTYSKEFDQAGYFKKVPVNNPIELFKLLKQRKVDVIVISEFVAREHLKKQTKQYRSNLKSLGPALTIKKLYILISKKKQNYNTIINKFNRGLRSLVKNGRMKQIIKEGN